jgi:hypothetical protein
VGNLRAIDTWYPGSGLNGPVRYVPTARFAFTTQGKAYRSRWVDLLSLLDGWLTKDNTPALSNNILSWRP